MYRDEVSELVDFYRELSKRYYGYEYSSKTDRAAASEMLFDTNIAEAKEYIECLMADLRWQYKSDSRCFPLDYFVFCKQNKDYRPIHESTKESQESSEDRRKEEEVQQWLDKKKKEELLDELKHSALDYVIKNFSPVEQQITIKGAKDKKVTLKKSEVVHEKFSEIYSFVSADEPVYIVGPAGSGKNHICKQIAKVMNLPFYFSNAVTQEYKLTGFTDANGIYHETQFFKAFKNGGIFMLDELDASIPEVLIILNAAIANRYFDFPAPIGYVEAHKDFRVVAAGNTLGYGADSRYVGRNQLDMASLDRFAVVNITYSPAIEVSVCPDADLLLFLREYRKAAEACGIETVVSYRAMHRTYAMKTLIKSKSELLDTCVCKGLCKDDLQHISEAIHGEGVYGKALRSLCHSRKE